MSAGNKRLVYGYDKKVTNTQKTKTERQSDQRHQAKLAVTSVWQGAVARIH